MTTNTPTSIDFFDLEDIAKEEQEEFFQDIGELVMQKILERAWNDLSSSKREVLTELLEASEADTENSDKQDAVLHFLDENVPNIREVVTQEMEELQKTYRELRDELLDALV